MHAAHTGDLTAMTNHDEHVDLIVSVWEDDLDTALWAESKWEENNALHRLYRMFPDKYSPPTDTADDYDGYDPVPTDYEVFWCKYVSINDCPDEERMEPGDNIAMAKHLFERIEDHWRLNGHYRKLGETYPESFFIIPEYVSAHIRAYGDRREGTFAHVVWSAWEEAESLSTGVVDPLFEALFDSLS